MLYQFARGIDDRAVVPEKPRKSIGIEVNWGLRFQEGDKVPTYKERGVLPQL